MHCLVKLNIQVLSDWALMTTNENGSLILYALVENKFLKTQQCFVQINDSEEILVFVVLTHRNLAELKLNKLMQC
jgi:hypothetical protein